MLGKLFLSLLSIYVTDLYNCSILGKALIGLSQRPRSGTENIRPMTALPKIEGLWQTNQGCLPTFESIRSVTCLALFNFKALFKWVVWHLSEKMLVCNNIHARGRANLPFSARLKPQRWLYLANTFLAPPPRGVVALVSVSVLLFGSCPLILGARKVLAKSSGASISQEKANWPSLVH